MPDRQDKTTSLPLRPSQARVADMSAARLVEAEYDAAYGGALAGADSLDVLDMLIVGSIVLLTGTLLLSVAADWPKWTIFLNTTLLGIEAFLVAYRRMVVRPDHLRAQQSERILNISRETVPFVRGGLTHENAAAVCEVILRETPATAAVSITDTSHVLAFVGVGSDHHLSERPIATRGTREVLENDRPEVLSTKEAIGCPDEECPLTAAIVVPVRSHGEVAGSLKFYYTSDALLTENELAMADGIASLLSVQLELTALEAQAALATTMELKALQAQISPHFLFNTLNTIGSFIRTDPVAARELLQKFASFYRYTLEHGGEDATLAREIEFVRQYFALEQGRFGDRLILREDVDESLLDFHLPAFMLQPLVENAVGHAMRHDGSPLTITIAASRLDDVVTISVADDGVGMDPEHLANLHSRKSERGLGMALNNVRDRLSGVYGPASQFHVRSAEGEGTTISLVVPSAAGYSLSDEDWNH